MAYFYVTHDTMTDAERAIYASEKASENPPSSKRLYRRFAQERYENARKSGRNPIERGRKARAEVVYVNGKHWRLK